MTVAKEMSKYNLTLHFAFMPSMCMCIFGYYSVVDFLYRHYMYQPSRPSSGVQVVVINESAAHSKAVLFLLCG
jgi:hypothetical protein